MAVARRDRRRPRFFALIAVGASVRVLREYERGVIFRLGRLIAQKGPGLILLIPLIDRMVKVDLRTVTLNIPPQEVITRDNVPAGVNAVAYFRVVDPTQGDHRGRELPARDLADLADGAALGARQGRARPAALRARAAQRRAAEDHRRVDRALGREGDRGRDQGRRDPRADAAGDGAPGRGRARAAGQDHQLRGRVPGGAEAHRRGRHHQHQPGLAAAALPADAARNRQQPEHDGGLPAADGRARAVHRPRRPQDRRQQGRSRRRSAPPPPEPPPLPPSRPTTSPPPAPERARDPHRPAERAEDDPRPRPGRAAGQLLRSPRASRRGRRAAPSARATRTAPRPRSTRCARAAARPTRPGWQTRVVPNLYPALAPSRVVRGRGCASRERRRRGRGGRLRQQRRPAAGLAPGGRTGPLLLAAGDRRARGDRSTRRGT